MNLYKKLKKSYTIYNLGERKRYKNLVRLKIKCTLKRIKDFSTVGVCEKYECYRKDLITARYIRRYKGIPFDSHRSNQGLVIKYYWND